MEGDSETNTDFASHLTLNKMHSESVPLPNGDTYSNIVLESVDVGHMDRHTEHHDETVVTTSWEVTTETFDWVSDYTAGSTPGTVNGSGDGTRTTTVHYLEPAGGWPYGMPYPDQTQSFNSPVPMLMTGPQTVTGQNFEFYAEAPPPPSVAQLYAGVGWPVGGNTYHNRTLPASVQRALAESNLTQAQPVDEDGDGDIDYYVEVPFNPQAWLNGNDESPEIAEDYARTFKVLKELPCELFLGAHGEYYGMAAKYESAKSMKAGDKNPFLDAEGYRDYVELKKQAYLKRLAEQKESE